MSKAVYDRVHEALQASKWEPVFIDLGLFELKVTALTGQLRLMFVSDFFPLICESQLCLVFVSGCVYFLFSNHIRF